MPGAQSWWRAGGPVSFVDPTRLEDGGGGGGDAEQEVVRRGFDG